MKNNELIIKNETEFNAIPHNKTLSSTFDKIDIDVLHIKNTNFNFLDISIIRKIRLKKIIFENCILGNLHYFNYSKTKEIQLINQQVDNYFINTVYNNMYFPNKIYFKNNNINNLSFLSNKTYEDLIIKNNNVRGYLDTLKDTRITNLYLDEITQYNISDLEYLKERLTKKRIIKVFFNDSEIDVNKIHFIERKLKIEKLINDNA